MRNDDSFRVENSNSMIRSAHFDYVHFAQCAVDL